MNDSGDFELHAVGLPEEFVRAVAPRRADQARNSWHDYLLRTLAANQRSGGRYNAPGEFGTLYTASDEATAWAELHARYVAEGLAGLPAEMGMIRLQVRRGLYVDLNAEATRDVLAVDLATLQADDPTPEQRESCWRVGRDLRAIADFLRAPSARASGDNVPFFIGGRSESDLEFGLQAVSSTKRTPPELRDPQGVDQW